MYGVFRTPSANNIDLSSPLGMPIFSEAIEEMKDLDIAYSRNAGEIYDSEKIILADDRLMFDSGKNLNSRVEDVKLPHYVKNVFGNSPEEFYQEIIPIQPHALTESMRSCLRSGTSVGFLTGILYLTNLPGSRQQQVWKRSSNGLSSLSKMCGTSWNPVWMIQSMPLAFMLICMALLLQEIMRLLMILETLHIIAKPINKHGGNT
mgnify:CR=1 FL=1